MSSPKLHKIILSRRRSQYIKTNWKLFPWAKMCIAEEEKEDYKEWPGEFLIHPNDIIGLGKKRNWILDQFQGDSVFMIDDDIKYIWVNVGKHGRRIVNPDVIERLVDNCWQCSFDAEVVAFGFDTLGDVRKFDASRPILFTRMLSQVVGVNPCDLRFIERKSRVDVDFTLQVLKKHRIVWIDNRFAFVSHGMMARGGGCQCDRNKALDEEELMALKKDWEGCISISTRKSLTKISININRRSPLVKI